MVRFAFTFTQLCSSYNVFEERVHLWCPWLHILQSRCWHNDWNTTHGNAFSKWRYCHQVLQYLHSTFDFRIRPWKLLLLEAQIMPSLTTSICVRLSKEVYWQNSVLHRSHHMIHVILIQLTIIFRAQLNALLSTCLRHSLNSTHSSARRLSSCVDELESAALGLWLRPLDLQSTMHDQSVLVMFE